MADDTYAPATIPSGILAAYGLQDEATALKDRVSTFPTAFVQGSPALAASMAVSSVGNYVAQTIGQTWPVLNSYVSQRTAFAGTPGALYRQYSTASSIEDPNLRRDALAVMEGLSAAPAALQPQLMAWLTAQTPTPQVPLSVRAAPPITAYVPDGLEQALGVEAGSLTADAEGIGISSTAYQNPAIQNRIGFLIHEFPALAGILHITGQGVSPDFGLLGGFSAEPSENKIGPVEFVEGALGAFVVPPAFVLAQGIKAGEKATEYLPGGEAAAKILTPIGHGIKTGAQFTVDRFEDTTNIIGATTLTGWNAVTPWNASHSSIWHGSVYEQKQVTKAQQITGNVVMMVLLHQASESLGAAKVAGEEPVGAAAARLGVMGEEGQLLTPGEALRPSNRFVYDKAGNLVPSPTTASEGFVHPVRTFLDPANRAAVLKWLGKSPEEFAASGKFNATMDDVWQIMQDSTIVDKEAALQERYGETISSELGQALLRAPSRGEMNAIYLRLAEGSTEADVAAAQDAVKTTGEFLDTKRVRFDDAAARKLARSESPAPIARVWESTERPGAVANDPRYYYHATPSDNTTAIATEGIEPRPSLHGVNPEFVSPEQRMGRAFVADSGDIAMEATKFADNKVLFRIPRDVVDPLRLRPDTAPVEGSHYATQRIPMDEAEFLGAYGEWHPVSELS